MPRVEVEVLVALLDDAFAGSGAHSLLSNLRGVSDADFTTPPPGGERSIADVLEHVGWSKWMYDDYAFRAGTLRGDLPPMVPEGERSRPRSQLLGWLSEGHRRLLTSVRALDDAKLDTMRPTNWGEQWPARRIVRTMIEHDLYHAGEINHIRAVLQGRDRWPYEGSA